MPYIDGNMRDRLDYLVDDLISKLRNTDALDGQLNYVITRLLAGAYGVDREPRYSKINDIVGILECAKLEFFDRIARPYEDTKMKQNGDVQEYKK